MNKPLRPIAVPDQAPTRPTRAQAEEAVRTLLAWAGDDPSREGLVDTPRRVTEAFGEYFSGYGQDPLAVLLDGQIEPAVPYQDIVLVRGIRVMSHCEHHIAPFQGIAHAAYLPNGRVAGLSRLARVVEVLARRLQTQEALTTQIADALQRGLDAQGAAVLIEAEHTCMTTRGVVQPGTSAVTTRFTGVFADSEEWRTRFLTLVGQPRLRP